MNSLILTGWGWKEYAVAAEYEAMKLRLWKKYEHDRDAYTAAKTDFIRRLTAEARRQYGNRYGGIGLNEGGGTDALISGKAGSDLL